MKRVVKRPILLLEVLIALALVALCAIPLLAPQTDMIRAERRFLNEIEADRLANVVFADIVQKMYENLIPWEALYGEAEVPIEGKGAKISYQFENLYGKPSKQDPKYALFELSIKIDDLVFSYHIFVEKEKELAAPPKNT